jgi:hypothetical protein
MTNTAVKPEEIIRIERNGVQGEVGYDFDKRCWDIFVEGEFVDSRTEFSAALNDCVCAIRSRGIG